jgi:hypothetical protein
MNSSLRTRLERLEVQVAPKGRAFVLFIEDQSPLSRDEQISMFEAERGVTPHDHLVVIAFA